MIKINAKTKEQLKIFFQNELKPKDMNGSLLNARFEEEDKFVDVLFQAMKKNEKIAIIGDYDVDGVTASAIMLKLLEFLNIDALVILPNRFEDGYGLNRKLIDIAIEKGAKTIITVDNGIREYDSIKYAKEKGLKVIVTDHHIPGEKMPPADLFFNPHTSDNNFQTKEICGGATAMLLSLAVLKKFDKITSPIIKTKVSDLREELVELAGVATICDVMPLEYENRKIVKYLINLFHRNEDRNKGIEALLKKMGEKKEVFDVESISFGVGPALNSTGRLDKATISLRLLTNGDVATLDEVILLNTERKKLTEELVGLSKNQIDDGDDVNVIYLENANEGIIGIISGKVAEITGKPTFIFTNTHEGYIKGSARGPEWCHLYNLTDTVLKTKDYSVKYGGHAGALGLSLKSTDCLDDFKSSLSKVVKTMNKTVKDKVVYEFPTSLSLGDVKTVVDSFEPFGETFEEPVFSIKRSIQSIRQLGQHYSFKVTFGNEQVDCTYFFPKKQPKEETYEIQFKIKKNINLKTGVMSYSLNVTDIQ